MPAPSPELRAASRDVNQSANAMSNARTLETRKLPEVFTAERAWTRFLPATPLS